MLISISMNKLSLIYKILSERTGLIIFLGTAVVSAVDYFDFFGYYTDSQRGGAEFYMLYMLLGTPVALLIAYGLQKVLDSARSKNKPDEVKNVKFLRLAISCVWICFVIFTIHKYIIW